MFRIRQLLKLLCWVGLVSEICEDNTKILKGHFWAFFGLPTDPIQSCMYTMSVNVSLLYVTTAVRGDKKYIHIKFLIKGAFLKWSPVISSHCALISVREQSQSKHIEFFLDEPKLEVVLQPVTGRIQIVCSKNSETYTEYGPHTLNTNCFAL